MPAANIHLECRCQDLEFLGQFGKKVIMSGNGSEIHGSFDFDDFRWSEGLKFWGAQ